MLDLSSSHLPGGFFVQPDGFSVRRRKLKRYLGAYEATCQIGPTPFDMFALR
jgi:hypothetical protein